MWTDSTGHRRGDDEPYDEERDSREAVERQTAIDDACYSRDPLTQFENRRRYYEVQNPRR